MQIRRALKPMVAIAAVLTYVASMAGVASAGTITAGQITVSGSPGIVFDFPGATSPCTTPPPPATGTVTIESNPTPPTALRWTVSALSSTSVAPFGSSNYLVVLSRTASTWGTVTGSGPYTLGDITLTLRAQIYATTVPGCVQGALLCTANLRMGLHGSYTGAVPTPPGVGTATIDGGTSYTGGIAISAPGCAAPLNAINGQSANITVPLTVSLP